MIALGMDADGDAPAGRGVLDRVADQVGQDLIDPGRVGRGPRCPRPPRRSTWPAVRPPTSRVLRQRAALSARLTDVRIRAILPVVIRAVSRRSSTSWVRCWSWRLMMARARSAGSPPTRSRTPTAVADGPQRVPELVREHGDELLLAAVALLDLSIEPTVVERERRRVPRTRRSSRRSRGRTRPSRLLARPPRGPPRSRPAPRAADHAAREVLGLPPRRRSICRVTGGSTRPISSGQHPVQRVGGGLGLAVPRVGHLAAPVPRSRRTAQIAAIRYREHEDRLGRWSRGRGIAPCSCPRRRAGGPAARRLRGRAAGLLLGERHPLLGLPLQLLGHPEQVDEDLDLRAEHLGHHRGQDVVDRPQRVAASAWISSLAAVTKMMGTCCRRGRCRIIAAVSKPSMSGMLTSSRITAKSRCQQLPKRFGAGPHADHVLAEIGEQGAHGDQLGSPIVDDEDIDRDPVCAIPRSRGASSGAASRAAWRPAPPDRPAWRGSPRRPPRCTSRDRPSWPWR